MFNNHLTFNDLFFSNIKLIEQKYYHYPQRNLDIFLFLKQSLNSFIEILLYRYFNCSRVALDLF